MEDLYTKRIRRDAKTVGSFGGPIGYLPLNKVLRRVYHIQSEPFDGLIVMHNDHLFEGLESGVRTC